MYKVLIIYNVATDIVVHVGMGTFHDLQNLQLINLTLLILLFIKLTILFFRQEELIKPEVEFMQSDRKSDPAGFWAEANGLLGLVDCEFFPRLPIFSPFVTVVASGGVLMV